MDEPRPWGTGRYWIYLYDERTGKLSPEPVASGQNQWQQTWGYIACLCLAQGQSAYRLNCMYLEYFNVTSPTDVVSVPSFLTSAGIEYYEGLASVPNRDYLRVPILATPQITPGAGFLFPSGQGNQVVLFAQSSGTVGMTGKPFSSANNSKLCGLAVVAAPVLADATQDIIFARTYLPTSPTNTQIVKGANTQLAVQYPLVFGV